MNTTASFLILLSIAAVTMPACKKSDTGIECQDTISPRKIQFSLYTQKDFSHENANIVFTLSIRNSASQILWDSILPAMKIKDIPPLASKLTVEKSLAVNDCAQLRVGFIYAIENVGISWFWNRSEAGEKLKEVNFSFQ